MIRNGDGSYVMYASASEGFSASSVSIYRLVSSDGVAWELEPQSPVLSPTAPSEGVETPAVVEFGGVYHLFYTTYPGSNDAFSYTIGHAMSDDGITFAVETTSLLGPTGASTDWNGLIVAEPAPVLVDGELYLYFTAVGLDSTESTSLQVIGLVRSSDGVTFSSPERVLTPDPELYPRADGWMGFSTPNAAVIDGRVYLFTDVARDAHDEAYDADWLQVGLQMAYSEDGRSGWVQTEPWIHNREDFTWTKREIRSVAVLAEPDAVRLWFAGDELYTLDAQGQQQWHTDRWGIGASICGGGS